MSKSYDKYYQTENLFGAPYPELISFFLNYPERGKLLDMGCGQGRDAIPLAKLGYEVTGVDSSSVGILQMNKKAKEEQLHLTGIVGDIYAFTGFSEFNFIVLDSMFHFSKKDIEKETSFIKRIIRNSTPKTVIAFCVQELGKKIKILNAAIDFQGKLERVEKISFDYEFTASDSGHRSKTRYKMIVVET